MAETLRLEGWALILGASSGFGAATARLNPGGRLTRPEDVAQAVAAMALSETSWISGNIIGVDAGENLTS